VLCVVILFVRVRAVRLSWMITMMLFNFACLTLCGYPLWVGPLIVFEICLVIILALLTRVYRKNDISYRYDIIAALHMVALPVILLFFSAFIDEYTLLYPWFGVVLGAYVIFLASDLMDVWAEKGRVAAVVTMAIVPVGVSGLFHAADVLVSDRAFDCSTLLKSSICMVVASVAYRYGNRIRQPSIHKITDDKNRLKLACAVIAMSVLFTISLSGI